MASFSIDDVRETLTADITRFLTRIEETAVSLAGMPAASDTAEAGAFRFIEEAGHAMYGTSSLVSAESLASSAKLLEGLAEQGQRELAAAAVHAERARRIAQVVKEGAVEMRTMLDLELEHRGDDAQWIALDWQERANAMLGAATAIESAVRASLAPAAPVVASSEEEAVVLDDSAFDPVGEDEAFSFDEEPASAAANDAAPLSAEDAPESSVLHLEVQDELAEVFRQEARECLAALRSHLRALFADHGDHAAARGLERLYHTIKGAAATVGLMEVSDQAHALQDRMQGVVERGDSLDDEILGELVEETVTLLCAAGLPRVEVSLVRSAEDAPSTDGSVESVFLEEAREICESVLDLLEGSEAHSTSSSAQERLGEAAQLFHRLKGSALVARDPKVHAEAVRLEQACREGDGAARSAAVEGVARLRAHLGGSESLATSEAVDRAELEAGDPELWRAFSDECAELLESMDRVALALEDSDAPRDRLKEILPVLHTLKGIVNTMGMGPTGRALHRVEDFVEELVGASLLPAMRAVASFLLDVQTDVRRALKQAAKGFVEASPAKLEARIAKVRNEARSRTTAGAASDIGESEGSEVSASNASALSKAIDRKFVRVGTDRLDALMNLAGELVVSRSRLLARVDGLRLLQSDLGRGGRRLIETVDKFCEEHEFTRLDGGVRPLALAAGAESMSAGSASLAVVANDGAWTSFGELELDRYEDIHILSRTLTELTSDFGEMYGQLAQRLLGLTEDADAFGGIVSGIQSEVTRARMVPLEVLFSRLRLPVRDAAERERKEARLTTRGEEVHLDKTIADALFQPMLHLVRNSVAHGIEHADAREAGGKPRVGTIEIVARQELGQIVLEVRDDGAGLDLAKLRARGVAMGLIAAETPLDDPSVADLVFAGGLSTETSARDVAGRGLGCEFVRRSVERLNGSIRVESQAGEATLFVLTLPLTLAITKALLVEQGGQPFAIPLYFAERILDADEHEIIDSAGLRRVRLDGQWVAVQRLGGFLGRSASDAGDGPIVVLRVGAERVLVQVDGVLGQEEVVVKNLGAVLSGHPLFAGVTIRGNGEMVLILDVPGLVQSRGARAPVARRAPELRAVEIVETSEDASSERPSSEEDRPLRIMFVDDSLSVRKVAEKALMSLGVHVTTAVDGQDALEKIRAGAFDLVFTDLEMPRMHGFELIRELRFLTAYQDLPIVVVTSRSGQKHQDQARSLGANEYLTKPFTAQSLGAAIEKLGRTRGARKGSS